MSTALIQQRFRILGGAAAFLALASASPALAGTTVETSGSRLEIHGTLDPDPDRARYVVEHFADSNRNGVRVRQLGFGDPSIFSDDSDCTHNPAFNDVVCVPFPTLVNIRASERDDEIVVGGSSVGCDSTPGTPVQVDLMRGNDVLRLSTACGGRVTSPGINRLHPRFADVSGGDGRDSITGGSFNDRINGGDGGDQIAGGGGADELFGCIRDEPDACNDREGDVVHGNSGNDTLRDGAGFDEGDVLDGDGGTDTVTYAGGSARAPGLNVTLDGNANDGAPDERDNLIQIERVIGTFLPDRLTGSSRAETLEGGDGNDELVGGEGEDILRGQDDDDVVDSRDGVAETPNCGAGNDSVIADLQDQIIRPSRVGRGRSGTCERIQRFAIDDGPPGQIAVRTVGIRRDGSLSLRLSCPRRARVACRGTVQLLHVGGRRTLAAAPYSVGLGRTRAVRLRVPRRDAARARARGGIEARTTERGVSRRGPRSFIAQLAVE